MRYRILSVVSGFLIWINKVVAHRYVRLWSGLGKPWFDHRFDYLRGPEYIWWQERGVLGNFSIPEGSSILDLCCGDGFYDKHYFSRRAARIDA